MIHEYILDYFIQIKHNGDDHGHDDDATDSPTENQSKVRLTSWDNCKYRHMISGTTNSGVTRKTDNLLKGTRNPITPNPDNPLKGI